VHWITWCSITVGVGAIGFVVASAIPFFSLLLSFVSAISFTPLAIIVPALLWLGDFARPYWKSASLAKKAFVLFHVLFVAIGAFQAVGGAYSAIQSILNAYDQGAIGEPFSCADNSGST